MGFSTMSIGLSGFVELHHAILARLADVIGEHGRAIRARRSVGELGAQAMAVEHVVAEDQRDAIVADEFPPQDEGMGEADRLFLNDVVELDAPGRAVAEQALIERQMLARRDQQDIADARQHQHRQRVVDHRLVVDRQQLLVDGERRRIEPRARAAGENDALHGMSLLVSKRSIVSASASRHGRGAMPNARAIAVQSSRVSAARTRRRRIVAGADRHDLRRLGQPIGRHVDDRAAQIQTRSPRPRRRNDRCHRAPARGSDAQRSAMSRHARAMSRAAVGQPR